jgi:hypothetical protein
MSPKHVVQKIFVPVALTGVLFLNACNSEKKAGEGDADSTATVANDTAAVVQTPDKVLSELPPPSEVPSLLQLSGADFNQGLLNSPDKAKNYTTTADKAALNLGVYATDVGYLCVYGKTQPAITYIRSSKVLADNIGVSGAFQASAQERFEKNLSNKDSLVAIIDENMRSTDKFLKESDRKSTAALAIAGGFIEGLYISTGLIEKYPKDVPANVRDQVLVSLTTTILKQKKSLADLIELLKAADQSPQVKEYTDSLTELYKKFEEANFEEKVKANKGDLIVNDKSLVDITAQVKQIRAKIVS